VIGIAQQGVKEQEALQRRLKATHYVVPPLEVGKFVSQDRRSFFPASPGQDVSREQDDEAKQTSQPRGLDSIR